MTGSQGGLNLDMAGGRTIRAPDVAFTPTDTYRNLTQQQLLTFQGQPFHPTVVVEVEDVSASHKLEEITAEIETEYFPAGIQLGLLVDPVTKNIFTSKRDRRGVVRRRNCGWRDISGGDFWPEFVLEVWKIDEAISQVCYARSSYNVYKCKLLNLFCGSVTAVTRIRVLRQQ